MIGLIMLGIGLTLYSSSDSWVRSGWLADFVWTLSEKVRIPCTLHAVM